MNTKTKVWVSVGLATAVLVSAGGAFAATSNPASSNQQQAQDQNDHHGTRAEKGGFEQNQELLALLKTDANSLTNDLKSGKSLADIASAHGISEQQVIDLLTKQETQKIDQAVQSGKFTSDKATQMKSKLSDRIKQMVERKGFGKGERDHRGGEGSLNDAASVLGLSQADLMTQLKSGKSIKQIAEAKGISEQQVIDSLLQKEKDRITKFVEKSDWNQKDKNEQNESAQNQQSQQNQ